MLKDKSRSNLKAGEALSALGLTEPAASRYYYAMYQAAVHVIRAQGWTPHSFRSGAVEWNHDIVAANVYLVRRRRSDKDLYRAIRKLRVKADYHDQSIDNMELGELVGQVRAFVEEVSA